MLRGGVWKPRTSPYAFRGMPQLAPSSKRERRPGFKSSPVMTRPCRLWFRTVDAFKSAPATLSTTAAHPNWQMQPNDTKCCFKRSIHMGPINELILARSTLQATATAM